MCIAPPCNAVQVQQPAAPGTANTGTSRNRCCPQQADHCCSQLTSATRPLSMTTVWSAFRTVLSLHSMAQHSTAQQADVMRCPAWWPPPACCSAAAAQLCHCHTKRCNSRLGTWHAQRATASAPVGNDNHGPPIGAHRPVQCRLHRGLALCSSRVSDINMHGLRQRPGAAAQQQGSFPAAAQQQHG